MRALLRALRHPTWWLRARRDAREERRLERAWPAALVKAAYDNQWTYALMLRDRSLVHFTGARQGASPAWVHLIEPRFRRGARLRFDDPKLSDDAIIFDRGVDVRVADIVWVTDAPWGS